MFFSKFIYALILAGLVATSIALTSRDLEAVLMMATLGFAFPLLFLPTLVPYFLAFAPIAFKIFRPFPALFTSVASIVVFGFGPGAVSLVAAGKWNRELGRQPEPVNIRGEARHIAIRGSFFYRIDGQYLDNTTCTEVCRKLLLTKQADVVQLSSPLRAMTRSYRLGQPSECVQTSSPGVQTSSPAQEECIVGAKDPADPPDLTVAVTIESVSDQPTGYGLAKLVSKARYLATWREAVVYDRIGLDAEIFTQPTLVVARDGGLALWKFPQNINGVDLEAVFRALGYRL